MNIKISKEQHNKLCKLPYKEYLFGSQLHGIANKDSDFDYVRVISDDFYLSFTSLARFLPNIHSFQHTVSKELQYLWMTETQFYRGLFSGDGNLLADIVLLNDAHEEYENGLDLCRCYRVIKGYLGVAKRDLRLHGNWNKKIFHALRSLYMAEKLMDDDRPTVKGIKLLKNYFDDNPSSKNTLVEREKLLREKLNNMLNKNEINLFPVFEEQNDLINLMARNNNTKEFIYK